MKTILTHRLQDAIGRRSALRYGEGKQERGIWANLGLAVIPSLGISVIGLIVITLIGAVDDAITKVQIAGYWWVISIVGYMLTVLYLSFEQEICKNLKRRKVANALVLYWKDQLEQQGKAYPSDTEIKMLESMLIERIKIWAWRDPELWSEAFPTEPYSKNLFGIIDNFEGFWECVKFAKGDPLKHHYSISTASSHARTEKPFRKLIRFEDKLWLVDLTELGVAGGTVEVKIVSSEDGTERPATSKDGSLTDVLTYGVVVDSEAT